MITMLRTHPIPLLVASVNYAAAAILLGICIISYSRTKSRVYLDFLSVVCLFLAYLIVLAVTNAIHTSRLIAQEGVNAIDHLHLHTYAGFSLSILLLGSAWSLWRNFRRERH